MTQLQEYPEALDDSLSDRYHDECILFIKFCEEMNIDIPFPYITVDYIWIARFEGLFIESENYNQFTVRHFFRNEFYHNHFSNTSQYLTVYNSLNEALMEIMRLKLLESFESFKRQNIELENALEVNDMILNGYEL